MKYWSDIFKHLTALTQFGLSFITPVLVCLALCAWASQRFQLGGWIYIPGFFFGMGGSFMVSYKLYVKITRRQEKEEKKKKVSFNRHI